MDTPAMAGITSLRDALVQAPTPRLRAEALVNALLATSIS
jgi:hypothetical protein